MVNVVALPWLLPDWCCSHQRNGLAVGGVGTHRGNGITANGEPSGKDGTALPLWCRNPRSERNRSQRGTKRQRWNGLAVGGVRTLRGNGITANGDPQRQEPPCIVIEFKRNSLSSFFLYNNLHIMNLLCIFVPTK